MAAALSAATQHGSSTQSQQALPVLLCAAAGAAALALLFCVISFTMN
jgi:hypothetical protein